MEPKTITVGMIVSEADNPDYEPYEPRGVVWATVNTYAFVEWEHGGQEWIKKSHFDEL